MREIHANQIKPRGSHQLTNFIYVSRFKGLALPTVGEKVIAVSVKDEEAYLGIVTMVDQKQHGFYALISFGG